jgi:predicted acyltransferase (DUF342 family)
MNKYIALLILLMSMAFMLFAVSNPPVSSTGSLVQENQASDNNKAGITAEQPVNVDTTSQESASKPVSFFKTTKGIIALILVFLILLIIPFIPAIMEMINPKDNEPLFINQDYTRDPRFLDKQFLEELKPLLSATQNGKKETAKYKNRIPVTYKDDYSIADSTKSDSLLIVSNNLQCGKNVILNQPIYIRGKAEFGEDCIIEIASINGDAIIGKNSRINSWLSSNSNVTVGKGVVLGKHLACEGILQLNKGCTFTNLYAMPIASNEAVFSKDFAIPAAVEFPKNQRENMTQVNDLNWYVSKQLVTIPAYSLVNNSMIIKTDLVLRKGSVVNGDLKVYGKVIIEADVRIYGELLCNGDIEIGEGSFIRENLFTQSTIIIKSGVRIGLPGQHKSVIGKKGISLGSNVVIYGNILTAGKGIVASS